MRGEHKSVAEQLCVCVFVLSVRSCYCSSPFFVSAPPSLPPRLACRRNSAVASPHRLLVYAPLALSGLYDMMCVVLCCVCVVTVLLCFTVRAKIVVVFVIIG